MSFEAQQAYMNTLRKFPILPTKFPKDIHNNKILLDNVEFCKCCCDGSGRSLHGDTKAPLQSLTPKFEDPNKNKPRRSARLASIKPHNHQLQSCINVNSLEIYKRSYRGRIPEIWNKLNSESLRDEHPHWKDCRRLLQKEMKKQH